MLVPASKGHFGGGNVSLLAVLRGKVEEEKPGFKVGKSLEVIVDEDPISLLRRKVLCALEYVGNYQEVLIENGGIAEVGKMERFAKDRVRDALVHAGFVVPPSGKTENSWGDACFDAIGVSSRYLVLGDIKWGDEIGESEVESLFNRVEKAEKNCRGREIVFFIASLKRLGDGIKDRIEKHPKKNFIVSFEEVRPYSF